MKKLAIIFSLLLGSSLSAQDVVWTEDFGTGCNQGQLASAVGWTITNTGANEADANTWYISAMENGQGAGNCGASCGSNRTLHVGNVLIDFLIVIPADQGAAYYDSGGSGLCGFIDCSQTDKRVESSAIDATGYQDLTISFNYIEGGSGSIDNATLWFYDGSSWSQLDDPAKTSCCGGACNGTNQGLWAEYSFDLPESANENANIKVGFRWVNNDDGTGTDPSFAVDDIVIEGIPVEAPECFGDFNNDGVVNTADLLMFLTEFACLQDCTYDLNGDSIVNTQDLLLFLSVFGTICE